MVNEEKNTAKAIANINNKNVLDKKVKTK